MKISVIGCGYVGLVAGACLADFGHSVTLIDIDLQRIEAINSGMSPIYEPGLEKLLSRNTGPRLRATTSFDDIKHDDLSLICVGTPTGKDGNTDLSMAALAANSIGKALRDGSRYHVVVVKSTVPPGTTESLVKPVVLEISKRRSEEIDFVMSPEFLREGSAVEDFMHPDRIVIGSENEVAGNFFQNTYPGINAPVLRTSLASAEMIKYASNSFLAMKVSFSNEIGNICKKLDIDVYEVMKGVGMDHRISPHFLNAGAGFGGSCFPKDVSALIHLAEDLGEDPVLLKSIMEVNNRQPLRMIKLLVSKIGDLQGKKIAVLGLAFKNNTDDMRESRAIPVVTELKRRGAKVAAYDPKANVSMCRLIPDIMYCGSAAEALRSADACLVMTEWPEFGNLDNEFDLMKSKVIIEGRRILSCGGVEGICW